MNERIKECMFNAGLNSNHVEGFDSIYSQQLEKFAELIVEECMDVVGTAVDQREPASTYVGKIKQHFGVEE
jgi:hypothetical protein